MKTTLLPVIVGVVVFSAFIFLNADGQPLHLLRFPLNSRNPNLPSLTSYKLPHERTFNTGDGNWIHGWPFGGLLRVGIFPIGHKGEPTKRSISGPFGSYSRWPFDDSPWDHINLYALLINAGLAIVVAGDAYASTNNIASTQFQFSIRFLLSAAFVVAVLVTLRRYILDVHDLFEGVALVIAFSAVTVTVLRSVMAVGSVIVSFFIFQVQGHKHDTRQGFGSGREMTSTRCATKRCTRYCPRT